MGTEGRQERPGGRIGGVEGAAASAAVARLRASLGPRCTLLNDTDAAIDSDLCDLDEIRSGSPRGAFAAAWRDRDGCIHLMRDAVGERTVYYIERPQGLAFASSLRCLLVTGLAPRLLNPTALAAYLTYGHVPGPDTLVMHVKELLPGMHLTWSPANGASVGPWWKPGAANGTLEDAVRRRLPPSDTPIGVVVSDSLGRVVSALHRGPTHTFSLTGGPGESTFDITPRFILRYLDECMAMLSQPLADPTVMVTAMLFREASRVAGVVFNDERPVLHTAYEDLQDMLMPSLWHEVRELPPPRHAVLHKVDALSAPFGVLARSPLFDRELPEPSPVPHNLPLDGWFDGPLRNTARDRLLEGLVGSGLFSRDWLERLLRDRRQGARIWPLIALEAWLRTVYHCP